MSARLTDRDAEILNILASRLRLLSLPQIARTWWSAGKHSLASARERLLQLEQRGHLHFSQMMVHPELPLTEPLCRWTPGEPASDFGVIEYKAQVRWTSPPISIIGCIASQKATRTFGAYETRFPKRHEQTHDLHLATVYLQKRLHQPEQCALWLSENAIRATYDGFDDKVPDAIISSPFNLAVDFIGKYKKPRLLALHSYCDRWGISYELW